MRWKNDASRFGAVAKALHWINAAAFIGAYLVVYGLLSFIERGTPFFPSTLNLHLVLGLLVGALVLPRLLWRLFNVEPAPPPGSPLEHKLATVAHWGLYGLMIVMPVTGYLGTGRPTDFGLFQITGFRDTALFSALSQQFGFDWETFQDPLDEVHHFVGKWIAWGVVLLHVAAALYHHLVRRDDVLKRMLPFRAEGA